MTIVIYEYIAIYSIKDIVQAVCVVAIIVLRMKAKTDKLVMDLLLGSQSSFSNKWLYQYSTDIPVSVFSEAEHTICTIWEIIIVSFNALEERSKVVIRIPKIVQFNDFRTIRR